MPKYCDKCGSQLKDNVKFCDKCGNKVNNVNNNQQSIESSYSCIYCGKTIPYSAKCPYCGKSLNNDDAAKCGLGVLGIYLLIILISGVVGFLLLIMM